MIDRNIGNPSKEQIEIRKGHITDEISIYQELTISLSETVKTLTDCLTPVLNSSPQATGAQVNKSPESYLVPVAKAINECNSSLRHEILRIKDITNSLEI